MAGNNDRGRHGRPRDASTARSEARHQEGWGAWNQRPQCVVACLLVRLSCTASSPSKWASQSNRLSISPHEFTSMCCPRGTPPTCACPRTSPPPVLATWSCPVPWLANGFRAGPPPRSHLCRPNDAFPSGCVRGQAFSLSRTGEEVGNGEQVANHGERAWNVVGNNAHPRVHAKGLAVRAPAQPNGDVAAKGQAPARQASS